MTQFGRYSIIGLCFMTLLLTTAYSDAADKIQGLINEETKETITRGVLNKQLTIEPQLNKLNFGLGRYDGGLIFRPLS